jgi:iron(III) transport system ATP-binding protein
VVSSPTVALPPEQRRIGMVFQDYALFPHLSVGRNVAFGIHDLPKAEQERRVAEVLELVGLAGSAALSHELSGGQQQRVALARAWRRARSCCCWTSRFPTWTWTCANAWPTRCAAS